MGTPGCLHFSLANYKPRDSHNSPLRFDNSLEWLTELRKALYLLQFITKDTNEKPHEEEVHRARSQSVLSIGTSSPQSQDVPLSQYIYVFTNQGVLPNLIIIEAHYVGTSD